MQSSIWFRLIARTEVSLPSMCDLSSATRSSEKHGWLIKAARACAPVSAGVQTGSVTRHCIIRNAFVWILYISRVGHTPVNWTSEYPMVQSPVETVTVWIELNTEHFTEQQLHDRSSKYCILVDVHLHFFVMYNREYRYSTKIDGLVYRCCTTERERTLHVGDYT